MSFWKSTELSDGTAQLHHRWLLAERSTNWKKTALKYPLLNPRPHAGPCICPHQGNFREHESTSQVVARGETGHRYEALPTLPSQLCWFMSFHTDKSWGEQLGEEGISSPCRKELGQGEGGVAGAEFRGKAVSGESGGTDTERPI